jgi:hypothetical protein
MAAYQMDTRPNEAASLYLARLQQALKTPNSIMIRVYRALSKEFQLIGELIADYGDEDEYLDFFDFETTVTEVPDGQGGAMPVYEKVELRKDFDFATLDVLPVADPAQGSDIERSARQQMIMDLASNPVNQGLFNMYEVNKRVLEGSNTPEVDEILPPPQPPQPDPQAEMIIQQQAQIAANEAKKVEAEAIKDIAEAGYKEFMKEAEATYKLAHARKYNAEAEAQELENDVAESGLMKLIKKMKRS